MKIVLFRQLPFSQRKRDTDSCNLNRTRYFIPIIVVARENPAYKTLLYAAQEPQVYQRARANLLAASNARLILHIRENLR